MAITYFRGHKCYFDGESWRYFDNDEKVDERRVCKKCEKVPTQEGYDACLGQIPQAVSACCGHGIHKGYIMKEANHG